MKNINVVYYVNSLELVNMLKVIFNLTRIVHFTKKIFLHNIDDSIDTKIEFSAQAWEDKIEINCNSEIFNDTRMSQKS